MKGMNRVILIGRLGHDPEKKQLDSGATLTTFSLATSDSWTDKAGERVERTEWHRIVSWGKTAELVSEYVCKGRRVCVEGRLQTRKWQDKEGKEHRSTEIVADSVTFLDGPRVDPAEELGAEAGQG